MTSNNNEVPSNEIPSNEVPSNEGILLINKPKGNTSFSLIRTLRKRLQIKKIGHAGTLDPFATGVMVYLIGRDFTRLSDQFLNEDKEYLAQIHLGVSTDTFDTEGQVTAYSEKVPTVKEVEDAVTKFQGKVQQIPPMYSAKKFKGQKLYDLARKGKIVDRQPVTIELVTTVLKYEYPYLDLRVNCSKGTYIRSIADDLGAMLGCGGHLSLLQRTRSGRFTLSDCIDGELLENPSYDLASSIQKAC
ncbi:MAG: tRNA pseudouridine55 synthase [Chlamydiales bacterium]|jgi:tRNA pseudouridine55 synthase